MTFFVIENACASGEDVTVRLENYNNDYIIATVANEQSVLIGIDVIIDYAESGTSNEENPLLSLYGGLCRQSLPLTLLLPNLLMTFFASMRFEWLEDYTIILRYEQPYSLIIEIPTIEKRLALTGLDFKGMSHDTYYNILEQLGVYVS